MGDVVVSVPPQTVAVALATVKPVGRVSVKAAPLSATAFAAGLVSVNVSEVVECKEIPAGLNTLAIEGGSSTFKGAEAVPPVPPSVDVTFPVVFVFAPAVVPVTLTLNVHELLAAMEPFASEIPFAVGVIVPTPHEPVSPFGVATATPTGKLSVKAIPVRAFAVLLF